MEIKGTRKASGREKMMIKKQASLKSGAVSQPSASTPSTRGVLVTSEATAPSYDRFGEVAGQLPWLASEYLALNIESAKIEKRKKEIQAEVSRVLEETKERAIRGDFFLAQRVTSHRAKKLSPYKMLECGIEQEVIDYCYEGGEEYSYYTITAAVGE